jgi:O-succinylbenzoic acid--CoA ligase
MNRTQLLSWLNKITGTDTVSHTSFISAENNQNHSRELQIEELIESLSNPHPEVSSFTQPNLKKPMALIQERSPAEILKATFNAWGLGYDALILNPDFTKTQTLEYLKNWGFKPTTNGTKSSENEPLLIALATSGSSGSPKLIGFSTNEMNQSLLITQEFFGQVFPRSWALGLPCWHVGGLMVLWRMLMTGGKVYEFNFKTHIPESIWSKVEGISLVPTQLQRLMDQDYSRELRKLSLVLIGGAACPSSVIKKSLEHKIPICLSYGSTETCSMIAGSFIKSTSEKTKLTPLPKVNFKIDSTGKLHISSPTLHLWRIENQKFFKQSEIPFYPTQDQAEIDEKLRLQILGRLDRTFISGGENVSAEKVENIALNCSLIEQAIVLIRPDKEFGQVAHLLYVPTKETGLDVEHEITKYLRTHLEKYEFPKSIDLMPEYTTLKAPRSQWEALLQQQYQEFKDQPEVLLIHGFMGLTDEFLSLKRALTQLGFPAWKISYMTLPGHDGLAITEDTSNQNALELFGQQIEQHLKTPKIIYAYSMGARVLSNWIHQITNQSHENIKGLILESAHPGGLEPEQAGQRLYKDSKIFDPQNVKLEEFIQTWSQLPLFEGLTEVPGLQELTKLKGQRHKPAQLYFALQAFSVALQPDVTQTWHKLSNIIPTLYLSGLKDEKYTHIGQRLELTHFIHPWASHNIHLQDPDWCAQRIIDAYSAPKSSS